MWNRFKTALFLGLLTGVAVGMGWLIGGYVGMLVAFGIAVAMNFGAWWFSDRLVLALYRAREVGSEQAHEPHGMVAGYARRADIPMPPVDILPGRSAYPFGSGRSLKRSSVAVTEGMLQFLDRQGV